MRLALREAERALEHDDVPIGAVIVKDGEVIAAAHNERELRGDPTAHAEVLALRAAATALGSWRVLDSVLYVTLEPARCARGDRPRARAARRVRGERPESRRMRKRPQHPRYAELNHRPQCEGGLLARTAATLLRAFFADRR